MKSNVLRNVLWNFGGQAAPMVLALFSIPVLISALGDDKFGLLAIGWMVVGYLSLFDFGLGRAMTRQISVRLGSARESDIAGVFWTALPAMSVLGAVGAVAGTLASPVMANRLLTMPEELRHDARLTLVILSLGLPVSIISVGLRGALEAFQAFRMAGFVRFATGVATYLVPVSVLPWTRDVSIIVVALIAARGLIIVLTFAWCLSLFPQLKRLRRPNRVDLRLLLVDGGWMSLSNIVSPIMSSLDRFLLGALLSVGAVTYYATPADALTKALILPAALTGVLFPMFASGATSERNRVTSIFRQGWDATFLTLFPVCLSAALLARPSLHIWLGEAFAERSTPVVIWLAFGVLANGMALVPFTLAQSTGNSRAVALIHTIELPIFIAVFFGSVHLIGITGAAVAWTVRVVLDLVLLTFVVCRTAERPSELFSPLVKIQAILIAVMVVASVGDTGTLVGVLTSVAGTLACGWLLVTRIEPLTDFLPRGLAFAMRGQRNPPR